MYGNITCKVRYLQQKPKESDGSLILLMNQGKVLKGM